MYRRHTMETVQYQDRTTATSHLWLTQIKIRGKQTAVLQTFFGCGNDGPVKVIWLHECSEGLKFSVRCLCRSGAWAVGRCCVVPDEKTSAAFGLHRLDTGHFIMHVALMTTATAAPCMTFVLPCTKVSVLVMVLCISEPKPGVNPWSQMWIKVSMKKLH